MVLSGRDIQLYIKNHHLVIESENGEPEESQFRENGFDSILHSCEMKTETFGLFRTRERFEMPDDIIANVCLRSSWARVGFIIPPVVVDAGFKGTLTVAVSMMLTKIHIPIGQRFFHITFSRTSGPCVPYSGTYQNQEGITKSQYER